ncbi:tRNA 2-thiouridine synthesizing protein D [Methylomarinovum caldicuralii]|uniref:tRNA 2-thiouridine synthesizing protein D n=1 Tax=Methylomarinovum caldicuralii TaxID=438856 RepID=A0AAU9BTS2_9GAMM|nr:DsrE family protein [Methylomarinovum caldicuralii]BCX82031.1 tRNA 2-thiouridine synthesizing protein D [Methylomarinovum caldicuralii]
MAKILISAKHGTNNPTLATLPYIAAKTAKEQGHEPIIFLWDEATALARPGAADCIQGVNIKPLKEVLATVIEQQIPVWVCKGCALARGVDPDNMIPNAEIKEMGDFIRALAECDKNVEY